MKSMKSNNSRASRRSAVASQQDDARSVAQSQMSYATSTMSVEEADEWTAI